MNISHERYMQRAIQLAKKGLGYTAPNPLVGAVLVYNKQIIGEGYHQNYGQAHAEVNALADVKEEFQPFISQSTLYVTLEPCSHHGKTPPCANLIIEKKIPKVVIGSTDINPKVSGSGIQKLQQAGIEVLTGVEEEKCKALNKRFFTYHQKKRPYIILKWAESQDGFMALPDAKPVKISHPYTDKIVHRWRSEEPLILIGSNTAKVDNPKLTNRLWSGKSPVRVVLDRNASLPLSLDLFHDGYPTLIYTQKKKEIAERTEWIKISADKNFLKEVLSDLYNRKYLSVFIEGGAKILQTFIDDNLWDESRIIKGNKWLKGGLKAPLLPLGLFTQKEEIERDEILYFKNNSPN